MNNGSFDNVAELEPACKEALYHLLIACADTKLLLGYHYGEWTFGPPEIEAAVACCSLCQAELGHVRLFHGVINKHFGDDPDELISGRNSSQYANVRYLDKPLTNWAELIAANYIVDLALTTLLFSLRESSFQPLQTNLDKMIQEEKYHIHHGQGWFRTLANKNTETKQAIEKSIQQAINDIFEWFGPENSPEDELLVSRGIKAQKNSVIFEKVYSEILNLSSQIGLDLDISKPDASKISWETWTPKSRRAGNDGPDDQILYHLKGSKNQMFVLS